MKVEVTGRRETELEAEIRQYLESVNEHSPFVSYTAEILKQAYYALRMQPNGIA